MRVDFPIPGSPPTSISDPGTNPPPRTLSSSPFCVDLRFPSSFFISCTFTGTPLLFASSPLPHFPAPPLPCFTATCTTSSTYVFHSPQAGHLPIHLGDWDPQDWQKKIDFDFAGKMLKIED
jgi:hypothetical protein